MTFEMLLNEYFKSQQFSLLSVRSKQAYMYAGKNLANYLGKMKVTKIKRADLMRYQNDTANKPALANMVIRVGSVIFSFAVDMEYMEHNPASRLKKLKIGSHVKWSVDEVKTVIALRDRKVSTAVALAWYTGQRESDVLSMRWQDYDGQYINVTQQKTNMEMRIKCHPDLAIYLDSIRGDAGPGDFIVSGEKKMSGQAFRNMLKRRVEKLGIEKVFHGIRKGVASSLAENRTPISEIAAIMGHKSIRMAAYYAEQANAKILTDNAVDNLVSCT